MKQTTLQHYTLDQIASFYENVSNRIIGNSRRGMLNNTDFSIISNNCWGGHVYRRYNIPYLSPTVGLYFYAEEYITFLQNLDKYLGGGIRFINHNDSKYRDELVRRQQTNIPIGLLSDEVEVVFLHYQTEKEAYEKWNRRCERVNFKNLIVKFSQMNKCGMQELFAFQQMKFNKKVLFLSEKIEGIDGIVISRYIDNHEVKDDTTYYSRHVDLNQLINT